MQDVADLAHINRVTFYAHFQDKYALLDHAVSLQFGEEIEKRTLDACQYTPENLRSLVMAVCEFLFHMYSECAQPYPQFESLVEGIIKQKLFELLSHWLEQWRSHIPTKIPATVATWSIYGLALLYSHDKKRPALEKFVDEALPLVADNFKRFAPLA